MRDLEASRPERPKKCFLPFSDARNLHSYSYSGTRVTGPPFKPDEAFSEFDRLSGPSSTRVSAERVCDVLSAKYAQPKGAIRQLILVVNGLWQPPAPLIGLQNESRSFSLDSVSNGPSVQQLASELGEQSGAGAHRAPPQVPDPASVGRFEYVQVAYCLHFHGLLTQGCAAAVAAYLIADAQFQLSPSASAVIGRLAGLFHLTESVVQHVLGVSQTQLHQSLPLQAYLDMLPRLYALCPGAEAALLPNFLQSKLSFSASTFGDVISISEPDDDDGRKASLDEIRSRIGRLVDLDEI